MPPRIAQILFIGYIVWLFVQDKKRRPEVSRALWIPLLWLLIMGSRPLSLWLGLGVSMQSSEDYAEGSPVDRLIFLGLILAGVRVLFQRNVNIGEIISKNQPLFFFYFFWLASVAWSDFPMVSFKRWVKDLGNVVMVFVVLTEKNPVESLRWLIARWCYILIPMSVLFIKYFPDLGRMVNTWTWEYSYVGVTTDKNSLGPVVFLSWVFLLWDMLDRRVMEARDKLRWRWGIYFPLVMMMIWLLLKANSQTSWVAAVLATGLIFFMRTQLYRENVHSMEILAVASVAVVLGLNAIFDLKEGVLGLMGRESNLTGRTEIWRMALDADINPLVGVGFYTFWMGEHADPITAIYRGINQAHNGFIEVYLNGGLIGLALLLVFLLSGYRNIRQNLAALWTYDQVRLILWLCVLLYNMTEGLFNRLSPLWFTLLVVSVRPLRPLEAPASNQASEPNASPGAEPIREEDVPEPGWNPGGLGGFLPPQPRPDAKRSTPEPRGFLPRSSN